MALAALVGAAFGSNKKYVHAQYTPWGAYLTAGLISVVMFETAHGVRLLLTAEGGIGSAPGQVLPLYNQVSWAVIPFLLTVGICRLARMNRWFTPTRFLPAPMSQAIWERCLDGIALAVLMFLAYSSAVILHDVLDIPLPATLKDAPYNPKIYLPTMLFSFLIGCVAVRDTRRAGLATVIDRGKLKATNEDESLQWSPLQRHLERQPAE
jgi:hypothetical protein